MSNGAALTLGPLRLVARWSLRTADHAGRFSFLIADMFRGLAEWRIWVPRTLDQATAVGYGSLFIVLLVAGFAGAVTSLQTGYQFTGALPLDLWYSAIKSVCFAGALTTIPCYLGFNTQQGAEGVGRATTTAVVAASVAILMLDALTTKLLLVAK